MRKGQDILSTVVLILIILALIVVAAVIAYKTGKFGPGIVDGPLELLNKS